MIDFIMTFLVEPVLAVLGIAGVFLGFIVITIIIGAIINFIGETLTRILNENNDEA